MSFVWLASRLIPITQTYFTAPMTEAEFDAWVQTYADAVENIPAPFVEEAFSYCQRTLRRKPTPGDIAIRAKDRLGEARKRLRTEAAPAPSRPAEPTPAELERRRALVASLMARHPSTVDAAPEASDEGPRPMSDAEIAELIRATGRTCTVAEFRERNRVPGGAA